MGYELRDHTADIEIFATAESLPSLFERVAAGMTASMCEDWPEEGTWYELSVTAKSLEALLFDYLDELIYLRDVEHVLPVKFEVRIDQLDDIYKLTGSFFGVSLDNLTAREVKAVTYSDMRVEKTPDCWEAVVVLDM